MRKNTFSTLASVFNGGGKSLLYSSWFQQNSYQYPFLPLNLDLASNIDLLHSKNEFFKALQFPSFRHCRGVFPSWSTQRDCSRQAPRSSFTPAHAPPSGSVEEVRSIRFNLEQEEELLQRHLSKILSLENKSSIDLREMASQQDLITALVHREKVQESTTNLIKKKMSSL